jgi:hypothetical protein
MDKVLYSGYLLYCYLDKLSVMYHYQQENLLLKKLLVNLMMLVVGFPYVNPTYGIIELKQIFQKWNVINYAL